jgi:serine/threonine-protein kinase HipA
MSIEINTCPGSLSKGHKAYSAGVLQRMFEKRKVSHILPFENPKSSEKAAEMFRDNRRRISISGVQEKLSLVLEKNKLRLTREGESGTYILKPVPYDIRKADQVPPNEHLTMQIARQVYKIPTAENVLIFFESGETAYLTRRFDYNAARQKIGQEDFASLAQRTEFSDGLDYKYEGSYEEMARLIDEFVPAALPVKEVFFRLVLFNYLFSNGDAHLKNFSVSETAQGDYILSPAYDLLNTRIHVNDPDMAMKNGLFQEDFETESFQANGYYTFDDFEAFGQRIGLLPKRVFKLMGPFLEKQKKVLELIGNSYLDEETKKVYRAHYLDRLKRLAYRFEK